MINSVTACVSQSAHHNLRNKLIKTFEYKIPHELPFSFQLLVESGQQRAGWRLVLADKGEGGIEWQHRGLFGVPVSKIRVYLKQPRKSSTLVTVYINRPLQCVDPFKMCEGLYGKLIAGVEEGMEKQRRSAE